MYIINTIYLTLYNEIMDTFIVRITLNIEIHCVTKCRAL